MDSLGIIGLGTMGASLARNAARNGVKVVVYNRTKQKTDEFIKFHSKEGDFVAVSNYKELVKELKPPRSILLMVKAGDATDAVISDLIPLLEKNDIIIDAGNSHFSDTDRRDSELKEKGIEFIGMGVSGGEEGALKGPSMMPGCSKTAYKTLEPLLSNMSARDSDGGRCLTHVGEGGSGHFVKMVHNGIEYGVMQIIAESYDLLKTLGECSNEDCADIYESWNETGELASYLLEITSNILRKNDEIKAGLLIDKIKDSAKQKGTGKWTTQTALDLGIAVPTITAAVDARIISGSTQDRKIRSVLPIVVDETEPIPKPMKFRSAVRSAVELSIFCAYRQGFDLIRKANEEFGWNIDLSEVARIWQGGCIIRAVSLRKYQQLYNKDKKQSTIAREYFESRFAGERQISWRQTVEMGQSYGIPVPAMAASLSYYDAFAKSSLPQNLVQAQRDYFGSHTYERTDKKGSFHTEW
ncbi:NADP-dependent phosphogluconate dehydrogenase [Candidatus Peregrinibacteria bacterium]|jgi:6-phosphogluconate dehydrogenase|nr:NADP-dependent phosphogluconate dehydrogenase [Candidatus Peregrinibacteria bacterium]MBT3598418.1 NADP-dependent phosphogluconate dehydrogenase [Candidatus Peregrinibacteria bacterium]MBT4367598.1 NADP-dependent phosphogluconate dehydrogenase [Candidatus Peregrinibacteria bacterium]MBT6731074.1 NADP-dependent phosphogluconate dehydrogenase [Candidatus Peregrinibacteria bacterium]MBT7009512.1 NADP-dependent phosphogluconate dehydrogenase [Candidatus Peregrinibacteria bacterium]